MFLVGGKVSRYVVKSRSHKKGIPVTVVAKYHMDTDGGAVLLGVTVGAYITQDWSDW